MRITFLIFVILIITTKINAFNIPDIDKPVGTIIGDRFSIDSKVSINTGGEKFEVFETDGWHVNAIQHKFSLIFKLNEENNDLISAVEIGEITGFRKWTGYLMPWIEALIFKPADNIDGCVERPYYHTFKRLKKGLFFNCYIVKHLDVQKRLYGSEKKTAGRLIRKAVRDGKVSLPDILLVSEHLYFAFSKKDQLIFVNYYYNPKYFDNYKIIHSSQDESEFHRNNISRYPKAENTMKKFIKQSEYFHQDLEKIMKADEKRRIFTPLTKDKSKKVLSNKNKLTDEIIKLNQLYKSGILTKEEFEKAKKRVLER